MDRTINGEADADPEVQGPEPGIERAVAIAVAAIEPIPGGLMPAGADQPPRRPPPSGSAAQLPPPGKQRCDRPRFPQRSEMLHVELARAATVRWSRRKQAIHQAD